MMDPVASSDIKLEPNKAAEAQVAQNSPVSNNEDKPLEQPSETTTSPETSNDQEESNGGVWNWIKSASNNQFVQKVMEKTKTGVDRMITTLDPGMTPYIKEGGEITVVVASDKEVKWGAVRDAFQKVFGAATVVGLEAQSNVAAQPVGYTAGLKGAQERINYLRKANKVPADEVCVAVENFIVEQLPEQWFDIGCVLLQDPENEITIKLFTMAVPVESDIILEAQQKTPDNYNLRWSGLAKTIGEMIQTKLPWVKPSDWHRALTGMSRREIIYSTALCLAELYKRQLPEKSIEQDV